MAIQLLARHLVKYSKDRCILILQTAAVFIVGVAAVYNVHVAAAGTMAQTIN